MNVNDRKGYKAREPSHETRLVINIKRHLMSRDNKAKLETTHYLLNYLQNASMCNENEFEMTVDNLVNADIVEYLCEAMSTQDNLLLGNIFSCFEFFLKSEKFAAPTRAAYVIECIQRSMFWLFKSINHEPDIMSEALKCLAMCLEEFHKTLSLIQLFGSNCNIKQMLHLISSSLKKKEELSDEIIINSSLLFFCIFMQNDLSLQNPDFFPDIYEITGKCLTSLAVLTNEENLSFMSTKISMLTMKIGAAILQFCQKLVAENDVVIREDVGGIKEDSEPSEISQNHISIIEMRERMLSLVVPFVQNLWIPLIMNLEISDDSLEIHFCVLKCINCLFNIEDFDVQSFSKYLAEGGLIVLFPVLLEWSRERECKNVTFIVYNIIVEFISSLSYIFLDISDWFNDVEFKTYLIKGINSLPESFHDWFKVLSSPDTSECCRHFLIFFFYFFCLFLPSLPSHELQLDSLIDFIMSAPSDLCPPPVLKALWFLYAEAVLCQGSKFPVDLLCLCTDNLINWLERVPFQALYTHHPAVIFWTFSTPRIPKKFQCQVLQWWLQKEVEGHYDDILLKMAFANEDVLFSLLDVVKYGEKEVASRASIVLGKAVISQRETSSESVICLLWDTLPSIFSEYCSVDNKISGYNVTYYMQAACVNIPSEPNSKLLLLCGNQIMKVLSHFQKQNEPIELRGPAIQIGLLNLVMAMKKKDMRVLFNYASDVQFLKLIYLTSGYSNPKLILPSIQLLMHIHTFFHQSPRNLNQRSYSLHIDVLQVLFLLIQDNFDILESTLQFLHEILSNRLPKPLMVIVTPGLEYISAPFLQILFRQLQNLCARNIQEGSINCWKAMGSVLMYAYELYPEKDLYSKLATQPWTHVVLRILLTSKKPIISSELLFFLCWWMQFYLEKRKLSDGCETVRTKRKSRSPYPNLFTQTMERISKVLIEARNVNGQEKYLVHATVKRILWLDAVTSQQVLKSLRNLLPNCSTTIPSRNSSTSWSKKIPSVNVV